jgi:UDP-N-acetylmuramate dehydrogenase
MSVFDVVMTKRASTRRAKVRLLEKALERRFVTKYLWRPDARVAKGEHRAIANVARVEERRSVTLRIEADVPLAPLTTLELGGAARFFARVDSAERLAEAAEWAAQRGLPLAVLGGGSNLIVPDEGFAGLVVSMEVRGVSVNGVSVTAGGGEPWDEFVATTLGAGLGGLECLSGIPGRVGATPIQNVGAYGAEVAQRIESVEVLDLDSLDSRWVPSAECAFSYRSSRWKVERPREVVTRTRFRLVNETDYEPDLAYAELRRAMEGRPRDPRTLRETVLELRRKKQMLLDAASAERRTAGSFFTNPIVHAEVAKALLERFPSAPSWPQHDGSVKLAAGWLIEHAGLPRGTRRGHFALSSTHALAIVHLGGGTTAELFEMESYVRDTVQERLGVQLTREPVVLEAL